MEKQSAKWIEFCRLYKQLTEDLDMASKKKKVAPKRIRSKTRKIVMEHTPEVVVPAVERKRAKSPFDFSFNFDGTGGNVHLSFHGLE